MVQLSSLSLPEMEAFLTGMGEKKYRAAQIIGWIARGRDIEEMSNLSKELRQRLAEKSVSIPVRIHSIYDSRIDDTRKLLYLLSDGNLIEGVLMRHEYGYTLCLSTQVGCRMGCKFCASTLEGRIRDLTREEMLGEVLLANRLLIDEGKPRLSNLVLMGSGEPLDNYDNVISFLRLAHREDLLGISYRSISLSTCGIVPGIMKLAQEDMPLTLSISLHAPNDEIRRQTMPVANAYPMDQLLEACRYYVRQTGRRLIIEYTLIGGVNDSIAHADELASHLRAFQCHVNLIPLNSVPERSLLRADDPQIVLFRDRLLKRNISVTVRRSMGSDIEGACGQLRRRVIAAESED